MFKICQEVVQAVDVVLGGARQVVEGGLDLLAAGEPGVPGVAVVLPALGQVVAVVLAQAAEPPRAGELRRLAL